MKLREGIPVRMLGGRIRDAYGDYGLVYGAVANYPGMWHVILSDDTQALLHETEIEALV